MVAKVWGDWNDRPYWSSWWVEVVYDTASFDPTENDGEFFSTNDVLYVKGAWIGDTCAWWDDPAECVSQPIVNRFSLTGNEVTSFGVDQYNDFSVSFGGPGGYMTMSTPHPSPGNYFQPDQRVDIFTDGNYTSGQIGDLQSDSLHTHKISISPVPEPATWAMMIIGFGATGSLLRRQRKTALPA